MPVTNESTTPSPAHWASQIVQLLDQVEVFAGDTSYLTKAARGDAGRQIMAQKVEEM